MSGVVLRCFPRVDSADLWLVCCGRLCEDLCFGHDSRGEIPCSALDSEDGSVHCSGVMVGREVKVSECTIRESWLVYYRITIYCIHNG